MNNIVFSKGVATSCFVRDEYIPIKISYDTSIGNNRYIDFYHSSTDLLEFAVDAESGMLKKFQITACSHFNIKNQPIAIPQTETSGCISLHCPQHNDCSYFDLSIFEDGVRIQISTNHSTRYITSGQVLFGLDEQENLVEILIIGLSPDEVSFAIFELQNP